MQTNAKDTPQFIHVSDKEWRCPKCNKLLLKGKFGQDTKIEAKCTRCKTLCRFAAI